MVLSLGEKIALKIKRGGEGGEGLKGINYQAINIIMIDTGLQEPGNEGNRHKHIIMDLLIAGQEASTYM